jgi:hypothetical protein
VIAAVTSFWRRQPWCSPKPHRASAGSRRRSVVGRPQGSATLGKVTPQCPCHRPYLAGFAFADLQHDSVQAFEVGEALR